MNTVTHTILFFCLASVGYAQDSASAKDNHTKKTKVYDPIELKLSPAAEPMPALEYRLLPRMTELRRGSAYPYYARLFAEESDELNQRLRKAGEWLERPLNVSASEEVREFLEPFGGPLEQIRLATYRDRCDWEYPIDEALSLFMRLPDVNQIRGFGHVVALQTRHHVAKEDAEAVRGYAQDGFAMARHIAEGPFLVHDLVAASVARMTLDQLEFYPGIPNSPNLYWALTALPQLVDIRDSIDVERRVFAASVPGLDDFTSDKNPDEWKELLNAIVQLELLEGSESRSLADQLIADIPKAERFLTANGTTKAALSKMSSFQKLVLWKVIPFGRRRDDQLKALYLPWPQSQQFSSVFATPPQSDESAFSLSTALKPDVGKPIVRNEQRIAALRIIEAIRMYMDKHGNEIPDSLDKIQAVPIPKDPMTGGDFHYEVNAGVATLRSTLPIKDTQHGGYRLRAKIGP